MTDGHLHMVRMEVLPEALARFAGALGLMKVDDEGHGYVLHAWLAAMFGGMAPKPFRMLSGGARERGHTLFGYVTANQDALLEHAQAFADPHAFAVLVPGSLSSKRMPSTWRTGLSLELEVLACPTSRKEGGEKDIYLRTLDRLGDSAPPREQVYLEWFVRQLAPVVDLTSARLQGYSRVRLARRSRAVNGGRRLLSIERPQVLFAALARVGDGEAFSDLLRRGVGRHRAFGFGMVLLRPVR